MVKVVSTPEVSGWQRTTVEIITTSKVLALDDVA
jgi:hypothetical protein